MIPVSLLLRRLFRLAVPVLALLLTTPANAAQLKQADEGALVTGVIAAGEVNRIVFTDDRARMVTGGPELDVTNDARTGNLYVRLHDASLRKPVNLFVATENGMTYQLLLVPEDVPAEQIVIEGRGSASAGASAWERQSPYRATLAKVVRALVVGETPAGFRRKTPDLDLEHLIASELFPEDLEVRAVALLVGGAVDGRVLAVTNHGALPVDLTEARFHRPGVLATWIPDRRLLPGHTTQVYNVVQTGTPVRMNSRAGSGAEGTP